MCWAFWQGSQLTINQGFFKQSVDAWLLARAYKEDLNVRDTKWSSTVFWGIEGSSLLTKIARYLDYRTSSIKPPPPGGGGLIYFKPICGGLNRDEGLFEKEGGLINLEKMTVSVLRKELEYKVEKLKYKKVGGHAAEDQNQIQTSSW